MYRVGIIGSENSHAMAFSEIFNLSGAYDDIRVTAIWGEDDEATKKISEKCGVPVARPEEMLSHVDAVMVTSRNGALHPGYARPFIERGLPAFVDKPIANDGLEAEALFRLAKEKGAPVMGGSSLKLVDGTLAARDFAKPLLEKGEIVGGSVFAPVSMTNPYGGFYFYAAHLVETALTIFGFSPRRVYAHRNDAGVSAVMSYDTFDVNLSFTDGVYRYGAVVLGKNGCDMREIDLGDAYQREVAHFAAMLREGVMPQPLSDVVMPVNVLNAIEQSYLTDEAVPVRPVSI